MGLTVWGMSKDIIPKRNGAGLPHKPDPNGHLRGLPQSFTRSQKERPLTINILHAPGGPLVANVLRWGDESATSTFPRYFANFRRKVSSGTGASNFHSRTFRIVSPIVTLFVTRVNAIITPSTER